MSKTYQPQGCDTLTSDKISNIHVSPPRLARPAEPCASVLDAPHKSSSGEDARPGGSDLRVRQARLGMESRSSKHHVDLRQVLAIRTHSLRKVFLGIKGVYYECGVPGQGGETIQVRWLEGYEFQHHVPHDVDFRILLTFLDLYRTLISFVLYKLYTEENLVYPPPLDVELDEQGENVGAFKLIERKIVEGVEGKAMSKREVKRAIRGIGASTEEGDVLMDEVDGNSDQQEEDFVERPSKTIDEDVATAPLTTYNSLLASSSVPSTSRQSLLFSPYTFCLSRETSSRTWEFVIRAMGGKVVTSLTASTPADMPNADSISHVVVDRPMTMERMRELEAGRKWVWVQPQWVADCVNKGKIIGAQGYGPGELLPPHLSPWDEEREVVRPWAEGQAGSTAADVGLASDAEEVQEGDTEENDEEDEDEEKEAPVALAYPPALISAAKDPSDPTLLHAAELEAERNGTSHSTFQSQLKNAAKPKASVKSSLTVKKGKEEDLRKIMMSNKKAKLYEKMKYSNKQKSEEVRVVSASCGDGTLWLISFLLIG